MIAHKSLVISWLKSAKAGETIVYARATFLPVRSEVAALLRKAADDGHVVLYRQRRMAGPGEENFRYVAKRTARPLPGQTFLVKGVKPLPDRAERKPQDQRIEARAALQREIAPQVRAMLAEGMRNGAAIARELGLYSAEPVHHLMRRLAA
ncbi:hypothetical protein C100_14925 [Sphingobium sp. C100]|uniref:hypothetical protein n=1 Tax=Sphingobium sp. C100 TaxID=1207055 RepID=UPI0003D671C1|nr:hypothetical protein [Sphingobium sp. C100]ETI63004.1 hypothetical protein C100_14925 [Sphingobium sp. C100]